MAALVFIGILGLLGLAALVSAFFFPARVEETTRYGDVRSTFRPRLIAFGVAGFFLVLTLIVWLSNSMFNVESRTVGVVTEFGKETQTVGPGLNFLPPWAQVTEFPTSTQSLDLDATDDTKESVNVKFDNGGQGFVNADYNWRVESNDKALSLYKQWKDFAKVEANVVKPRAISNTSQVVGVYAPQAATNSSNNEKIATDIKNKLNDELGRYGIVVDDVNIKRIDVDRETQARINKQAAADADIETANSKQKRARIDNQTNKEKQASLTPGALIDKCLDVVNAWDVNKNGPLPAGWNCMEAVKLGLSIPAK